jgi:DNA-directed RNA polymerase sigma subunit (sigma70/sigma32)
MRKNNRPLLSHAVIGQRLGISTGRVQQLEQRALRKLRAGLLKLGVKSSLPPSDVI